MPGEVVVFKAVVTVVAVASGAPGSCEWLVLGVVAASAMTTVSEVSCCGSC